MATFPGSIPVYAGFISGDTLKVANHAAQHNAEQADIAAIATKVGTGSSTPSSGNVLTGSGAGTSSWSPVDLTSMVTGVLPVANGGTGKSTVAGFLANVYPVGCIYTETTGVNPGTTFGFGTWSATGQGRVLIGNGSSDQAFAAGATGGESNHLLSSNEMPSHTHTVTDPGHTHVENMSTGANNGVATIAQTINQSTASTVSTYSTASNTTGITNQNTGGGASHNNLPPYLVVYFWQRIA